MDGRNDREGCGGGEELCDICQCRVDEEKRENEGGMIEDKEEGDMRQRELEVEHARYRAVTLVAQEHQDFLDYKKKLADRVLEGCPFCKWQGSGDDRMHSGLRCDEAIEIGGQVQEAYELAVSMEKYMRRRKVVESFGCCLGCFVPQELCNGWEENREEGGWKRVADGKCQYEGVMISIVAWVWVHLPSGSEELYSRLGFSYRDEWTDKERKEQVWRWMGRRVIWGGTEALQICQVFNDMIE
jgi:hypothetical protein